jgi:Tfp pilus assembly protein PilF
MLELGNHPDRNVLQVALQLLDSNDPMLRWGAIQSLEQLPLEQRFQILESHFADSSQTVRLEIALALAGVPLERLSPEQAAGLRTLFNEFQTVFTSHADIPETRLQLGLFFAARRQWEAAEQAYQGAIEGNPQLLPAYLNQADLYRALRRDAEGRKVLLNATRIAPEQGAPWHALGLLEVRSGNREQALRYLEKAADLERSGVRMRYVYAIALHDNGETAKALDVLKPLLRETPENPDLLLALATYAKQQGRREEARRYAARLREIMPGSPSIQQLYDSL